MTASGSILPAGWTWSDVGHGALDVAGLVPVVGEAADLANASWYANDGEYLEAGLSLVSCVPVVGDVVGKGGKVAKRAGGKGAALAADALKKMDFAKALERFRTHPKLGPHVDKIARALADWRKGVLGKAAANPVGPVNPCPFLRKVAARQATEAVSKTPVPKRILDKMTREQKELFEKAVMEVENAPIKPRKDAAVFYSGKAAGDSAWKIADAGPKYGYDTVNSLTGNLLNKAEYRKKLPDDAMNFIDSMASSKLAQNAEGKITFVGDPKTIHGASVFRQVELPALLENPKISAESRRHLLELKKALDKKWEL